MSDGGFFPPTDVTVSLRMQPLVSPRWTPAAGSLFTSEEVFWLRIMARVPAQANRESIQSAMSVALARRLGATAIDAKGAELALFDGRRGLAAMSRTFERPLTILGGVAAMVFLIACVNVAGLVLACGVARQREFWIRLALGAGRGHLIRQTVVEALLLAGAGGLLGMLLAFWGARALIAILSGATPHALDVTLDLPLVAMGAGVSLGAALLFGALPALRLSSGASAPDFLRQTSDAGAPKLRAGRALVAIQIAVSVPLVVGCVLFLRTVYNLASVELGFEPRNLVIFKVAPGLNGYDNARVKKLFREALARIESVPGASSATLVENALASGLVSSTPMSVDGAPSKSILVNRVGPAFFQTMGMKISAGREIGLQDRDGAPRVAVINEAAVRAFFGGQNPIGRHVRMHGFLQPEPIEVVGVARDSKYSSLKAKVAPTIFLPFLQSAGMSQMWVAVRSDGTPAIAERLRAVMAEVDRDVPITDLKTQAAQIEQSINSERMLMTLLVFFGGFALVLACIGLHGITAYSVARRTSEIGIRMALGAQRRDVVWLVLRQVVFVAAAGLLVGVPAAVAASRSVRALLFGVEPADPWSIGAGGTALFIVALVAGLVPASRAARLDPLIALRHE